MSLYDLCEAIEATAVSAALRESLWLFPVIESVHLVGLAILGGSLLMVDLRLMGAGLNRQSIAAVEHGARRWFLGALLLMLVTGSLLGISEAVKLYDRPAFFVKMIALATALVLTFTVRRALIARNSSGGPAAFAIGAASLSTWLLVAVAGRWIGFS
ncbi:MAG: DUF6644 family protein [Phenylobacterium sp.]|uniref:DUF6644 family protein n=1 Tax=Phenylobacterium sp. TaxID=1871053 RepID=UPI00301A10C2